MKFTMLLCLLFACGDDVHASSDAFFDATTDPRSVITWTCDREETCADTFDDQTEVEERGTNAPDVENDLDNACLNEPRILACRQFVSCFAHCAPKGPTP